MQTYTGLAFYPLEPDVADVDPADIAHALSMTCRYGGHVSVFYSVAEHCVLMSEAVDPTFALWALIHDAAEAYISDLIRPIKHSLPAYRAIDDRLTAVIAQRFGLYGEIPEAVVEADLRILRDERDALMSTPPLPWDSIEKVPALGVPIHGWNPAEAERAYALRLEGLTGEIVR